MSSRDRGYVADMKHLIDQGNLLALQEYYRNLMEGEHDVLPAWDYIYQTVYLHACLKHKTEIVDWMKTLFPLLPTITQIAMRQVFAYGNYLQKRNNPYLERVKN